MTFESSPRPLSEPPAGAAPLYAVGLGPGDPCLLAPEARACLEMAGTLAGYSGYLELVPEELRAGRRLIATGMMGEVSRAEAAIDAALAGSPTAVVCSGDPGVYALAGLLLELLEQRGLAADDLPLRVIPGIPAVCAAAALLGAPLMHDFACISLSDLLTPRAVIEKRLESAFAGDFVTVLYNPRSKRRSEPLELALAAALRHRAADTPAGIVRNAFRPQQRVEILPLAAITAETVDMFSLVIIGNSHSRIVPGRGGRPLAWDCGARLLTPRGYMEKYGTGNVARAPRTRKGT